jgi:indolepyruvate ferredoxin oxidoreductase
LSVQPVDTELGRKTQIDQTSCNTDYSCLDGDCPSFVTVEARPGRQNTRTTTDVGAPAEPAVRAAVDDDGTFELVAVGIGGTGVVTLNQIIATAAWAEGLGVRGLDQTGLSQKGGPVVSHLVLSRGQTSGSNAVGTGRADVYLALDPVAALDARFLAKVSPDRTAVVATTTLVPTIGMVLGSDAPVEAATLLTELASRSRADGFLAIDAAHAAEAAFGDAAPANIVVLGAAYQRGLLPISATAIEAAILANGVAVDTNVAAFRLGRGLADGTPTGAEDRPGALSADPTERAVAAAQRLPGIAQLPAFARRRTADLVDYQGVRLARRYVDLVSTVAAVERAVDPGSTRLAEAVGAAYFKLLAYKDEYEVARLHLLPEFQAALSRAVPGGDHRRYLLHPPFLRGLGMQRKLSLPPAVAVPAFRMLRGMRKVRGTPADVFGHTAMRRLERRLAADYDRDIRGLLPALNAHNLVVAADYAALPLEIRGYESVKLDAVAHYEQERARLREQLTGQRTTVSSSR